MANCWICNAEADKWNNPEARLCGGCWNTSVPALERLGFQVAIHEGKRTVQVTAPAAHAPIIQLAFRAESYGSILKKLIKKELQIGRQSVDDQVYFEVANEEQLPWLRPFETSELMATLSASAAVEVANGTALAHITDSKADLKHVAMCAGSLLHFLRINQNLVTPA